MKYILLVFITLCSFGAKNMRFTPYTKTGHDQFEEIEFVGRDDRLLINYSDNEIKKKYKELRRKAFGTDETYFTKYAKAKYKSNVIFSRSNKTSESYIFSYDLETVKYKNVSVAVKGSLSAKKVFKAKAGDFTQEGDISMSYQTDNYIKTTESGKMNVVIYPDKKLTLRIIGDARVSNGVSKYYFFGICFQKGEFEIVEVQSTIYELREEDA